MPSPSDTRGPWAYMGRYKARIAVGIVLLLLTNVLFLGIPVVLGRIVNALLDDPDRVPMLCLWLVIFAAAQAVVRIASRVAIFNAARMAEYDLRGDLFGHLLGLEPGYYRTHPTGDVMSRLTNDVQTVRGMWGAGTLQIANTAFAFATVLVMMVRIDPVLTLWAALPYPAMVLLGRFVGRRIYRASRDVQAQLGRLSSSVQEDLTGINIIKTYTLEEQRTGAFDDSSRDLLDKNMVVTKIRGALGPLLTGLASLGTVVVLWVGGKAVINGRIDLGQLIEFNSYLARLVWPTLALGWMLSLFQRGLASWGRLAAILDTEPTIRDGDGPALDPASVRGRVEIRDLTLEAGGRPILDGVSITMPPGSVTAVVGRTGAGKSTLVDAMCRLVEIPSGAVFLDGHDVTDLPLDSLRGAIGYAPQDAFLFSTTIRDNILFGIERRNTDGALDRDAEVRRAALAAGLTADLDAFPAGFETVVGERGITLSGGQRQRVALARALATAPRVLLLDDSLSSVDAETEREILEHLGEHLAGRTALLISHRVAAVRRADQIVVLDEGRVVETGTHEQLLAAGGLYAELYQSQLAELPDEAAETPETAERAGGEP